MTDLAEPDTCQICDDPEICENCYGNEDVDCSCDGGYITPNHCCDCGENEYQCVCCPSGEHRYVGTCSCVLTITRADGTTRTI